MENNDAVEVMREAVAAYYATVEFFYLSPNQLKNLLAAAKAEEREECARFIEDTDICGDAVMDELATAIRARGEK